MNSSSQPSNLTPPAPLKGRRSFAPVSAVQKMMRALVVILQQTGAFKLVSEDVIKDEHQPNSLMPACIVEFTRARYVPLNESDAGRPYKVEGVLLFDVQGLAPNNANKSTGYAVCSLREALVFQLLRVLANNPALVVALEEFDEAEPVEHALDVVVAADVEHVPVLPPLTRSLVRATVTLVEELDERDLTNLWRFGALEGGPLDGEPVEATVPFQEE